MVVRERLDAIAARDHDRALFGAEGHDHHRLAPLVLGDVLAIEAHLGAALPDDLRTYLLEVSAGGVGPGYGLCYLPALLVEATLDDDEWLTEVARRAFADVADARWAAKRFAPLSDAEIEGRIASANLPPPVEAHLRQAAESVRTFEGRRDQYLASLTDPLREPSLGALLPLSNDGCGRVVVIDLADSGRIKMLELETGAATLHAPSFGVWITSWLDACERALTAGVRPNGRAFWG